MSECPRGTYVWKMTLYAPIAIHDRIVQLARESGCSPQTYVLQIVEDWLREHRSGKMPPPPAEHFLARDYDEAVHE